MKYTKTPLCHGYANQILAIDLGSGKINPRSMDPLVRDFSLAAEGWVSIFCTKKSMPKQPPAMRKIR